MLTHGGRLVRYMFSDFALEISVPERGHKCCEKEGNQRVDSDQPEYGPANDLEASY